MVVGGCGGFDDREFKYGVDRRRRKRRSREKMSREKERER